MKPGLKSMVTQIELIVTAKEYKMPCPDHTNFDRAAWLSTLEEALAKAIVQIVLSRQAEQASQALGSPK
jgi:hypothetical protein